MGLGFCSIKIYIYKITWKLPSHNIVATCIYTCSFHWIVDQRVASIHDHSNYIGTVGMGELVAVLNGVEFRTRHNDYKMQMPSKTSMDYGKTEPVPYPKVPPAVGIWCFRRSCKFLSSFNTFTIVFIFTSVRISLILNYMYIVDAHGIQWAFKLLPSYSVERYICVFVTASRQSLQC